MCKMPIVVFVNRQCNQTKLEASHAYTLESDEPVAIDSRPPGKEDAFAAFLKMRPVAPACFVGCFFGVSFASRKVVKPIFTWFFRREPAIVDIMWPNKSRRFVRSLFSV